MYGQYLCKTINDHCILYLQETHQHYRAQIEYKFWMCKEDEFTNFQFIDSFSLFDVY
jgi:hypothetical protein